MDGLSETDPGFVSVVTVVGLWRVLRRAYGVGSAECADVVDGLPAAREILTDQEPVVRLALAASSDGTDFADAVIAGRRAAESP